MRISDWSSDVCSSDLSPARPSALDHQPGDRPQWRTGSVSRHRVGSGRVGPCAAPEALQAGLPSDLAPNSIEQTAPQMVARADRGLAQAQLSGRRAASGVTRDDLQKPVHSRSEEHTSELQSLMRISY